MQLDSALRAHLRSSGLCGCRIPVDPGPPEEGARALLLLPAVLLLLLTTGCAHGKPDTVPEPPIVATQPDAPVPVVVGKPAPPARPPVTPAAAPAPSPRIPAPPAASTVAPP